MRFFIEPGSAALKEFEEAAEEFMGEIEFFAVVTSYVGSKHNKSVKIAQLSIQNLLAEK